MGVRTTPNEEIPALSKIELAPDIRELVEALKHFVYVSVTSSPRLQVAAYRGIEIVETIFNTIVDEGGKIREELLPDDYRDIYRLISPHEGKRVVCDFIASMTDAYALEFYGRLKSENPQTIFKPL